MIYQLFISHSWSHHDAYRQLVALLEEARGFDYRMHSIPKNHPVHREPNAAALREAIKQQLEKSHVAILLGGVYDTYGDWIRKEIAIARAELGTPVLVIQLMDGAPVSEYVRAQAQLVVGWHTRAIVSGIRSVVDKARPK